MEQEKGRNIETAHSAPCTWRHNVFGFYDGCFHPLSDKCEQGQAKMLSFPRKLCCVTVISGVRDAARVTALANDSIRSRWVILAPIFFFEEEIILSISCFKQKNIEPVQLSINLSAILWTFITDKPKQVHVVLFSVHFHSFDFALLVTYKFESFGQRT